MGSRAGTGVTTCKIEFDHLVESINFEVIGSVPATEPWQDRIAILVRRPDGRLLPIDLDIADVTPTAQRTQAAPIRIALPGYAKELNILHTGKSGRVGIGSIGFALADVPEEVQADIEKAPAFKPKAQPRRVQVKERKNDIAVFNLDAKGVEFVETAMGSQVRLSDGSHMDLQSVDSIIPCFTPGTLIATPRGEVPVERLRVGDRVVTRDNGLQEVRWFGAKLLGGRAFVNAPHLRPVLIKAGALGNGLPKRDMQVSPDHRILLITDKGSDLQGEKEVFVRAGDLVGVKGIHQVDALRATYIHMMFDEHEVLMSNGAWTESYQPDLGQLCETGAKMASSLMGQGKIMVKKPAARATVVRPDFEASH